MRSSDLPTRLRQRTLEGLLRWLRAPDEARWLLVGVPSLRLPEGCSRAVASEGMLEREQLSGCPAFDAALLVVGERRGEAEEALDTARSWLMPGAPLAVVSPAGSEAYRGLRGNGLWEAHGLPFSEVVALRALGWAVLAGRAGDERDRQGHLRVGITQNGKAAGVLLSPAEFDRLSERASFVAAVQEGLADATANRTRSHAEVVASMKARTKARSAR